VNDIHIVFLRLKSLISAPFTSEVAPYQSRAFLENYLPLLSPRFILVSTLCGWQVSLFADESSLPRILIQKESNRNKILLFLKRLCCMTLQWNEDSKVWHEWLHVKQLFKLQCFLCPIFESWRWIKGRRTPALENTYIPSDICYKASTFVSTVCFM
jgi:hypothetical protein